MKGFWKGLAALLIISLAIPLGSSAQVGSLIRRFIGTEDIQFATGGTGAVETFSYVAPSGNVLTLHKLDASYLKFRTDQGGLPASVEALVDGSNTIYLKPYDVDIAHNLTVTGTSVFTGTMTVSGAMNIAGLVTFGTIPVGPASDPTTANQLTRKSYVDAQDAANLATCVLLTGNQTVAGVKTFSSFPITPSSSPTTDYQVANKQYVDAQLNAVIQVKNLTTGAVSTGTTVMPCDDTIPQNSEGDEYMTLAITPTSATNKLKIDVVIVLASGNPGIMGVALFQDSTSGALAAVASSGTGTNLPYTITLTHYMTAGTTSTTTFKIRSGCNLSGTTTFNGYGGNRVFGGVCASSITISEIKP